MLALCPTASVGTTSTKRLGCLLALRVWLELWTRLEGSTIAMEGVKGGMWVVGTVDKPNDCAVTQLSLKCSSAEPALTLKRREPSMDM